MSDIQDTELMIRAGEADDESAFAILVERYQNILLNHFLRKGVSYSDGEDLVQRTFLRLWRYRSRYSPQAKFTTFLFLLANQESIDFFRAAQSRRALEDGFAAGDAIMRSGADAVFFDTDRMALGFYRYAWAHRIRIPDDISVVAFDDDPFARVLPPPSVLQPE